MCEIKNYPYYDKENGTLGKTITRKIMEILEKEKNEVRRALPDLAYLAARNDGLDTENTQLGAFMSKLLKLADDNNVTSNHISEYMKGVVMAVYVFESLRDKKSLANRYLGCHIK
ncbi:hypothetical protein CM19_13055 [Candidatus Acidianus copahuensis]|uniref:Uncharacterized protein n=1 Tax=Candidatus Acidianus copahuensis TaxID=1160895 RepID=A0A031LJ75_9CREN|nr:hypothetical protein CM19_13055 [Candidatus Acidianus copahuensis]